MNHFNRLITVFVLGSVISACATRPVTPVDTAAMQEQRSAALAAIQLWGFSGRIALSDGEQGGSGRLDWRQQHSDLVLNFHAALGQGSWRLTVDADSALLESGGGDFFHAADANSLMHQQLGWEVPVDALKYWVRGLPDPGQTGQLKISNLGLPSSLEQQDWIIEYQRWDEKVQPPMPKKLVARQGEYQVKLIIRDWQIDGNSGE